MTHHVDFVDLTLRDGQQSLAATRMTTDQALRVLPMLNEAGYAAFELWGGATLDSCVRFLDEDPWERLDRFYAALGTAQKTRILLRGQNLFAYQPFPDDLVIAVVQEAVRSGVGIARIFDALNDWRNLQLALLATKAYGGKVEAALSYTTSPVHTTDYFVKLAHKLEYEGADRIAVKDMAGLLYPTEAFDFFDELKRHLRVPVTFHSHTTTGVATLNAVIAMYAGIDALDTAITPFAGGPSHPPVEVLIVFAEEMGIEHGLDKALILRIQQTLFDIFEELHDTIHLYGKYYHPVSYDDIDRSVVQQILTHVQRGRKEDIEAALTLMRELMRDLHYPAYDDTIFKAQIPGGMLSNLQNQLKQMQKLDLLDAITEEIPRVRADVGYVPLVTPTSQIVGAQATFNVMMGSSALPSRYQMVSNEFKMLLRGEFGHLPTPANPEVVQQVLGPGESPLRYRPASYLMPVLEDEYDLPFIKTRRDLLLHLMLKQPADEFLKRKYGILNGN
ncbi:MAG: oxaloacetate decarboxylase subunit alpha [Anaerolineae bacterium]